LLCEWFIESKNLMPNEASDATFGKLPPCEAFP